MIRLAATSIAVVLAASTLGAAANAEVVAKSPDGMTIRIVAETSLDRDLAWARLLDVASWWSGSHTYSGEASSLSFDAKAGGCWCEMWGGGEVEHGRVITVMPRDLLRFDTALGPLQELGVKGVMTFTLSNAGASGNTKLTLDYKVSGSSLSGLDKLAGPVEQVLAEQVARFISGK